MFRTDRLHDGLLSVPFVNLIQVRATCGVSSYHVGRNPRIFYEYRVIFESLRSSFVIEYALARAADLLLRVSKMHHFFRRVNKRQRLFGAKNRFPSLLVLEKSPE
jgi:hypothetical protein